jgi:acyl-CoA synthetase (AMP-forming)/AMP-acid ligase II
MDEYHARTAQMIVASGASLVLADRRVRHVLGETVRRAAPRRGCLGLGDLPAGQPWSPVGVEPDDLALVQFSSGTIAEPKPIALSHRAVVAQVVALNGFWPDSAAVHHSGVSWLPLYHDMGLIGTIFTALERPATVTLIPPEVFVARPATWLRALSDYGATVSAAPTFGYARCLHRIRDDDLDGVDLSHWSIALCGGETAVPEVLRAFASRFARWGFARTALTPVYGLAEAGLAVTFSDPTEPFVARRFDRRALGEEGRARESASGLEIASVGRPLPGVDVRVVGDERVALPDGHVGVIECHGPSLMTGYLGQPDMTAQVVRDGWLDTGDLGFVLEGELYLTGRAKDMLLLRGRNYPPDEVERAVESVPGVRAGRTVAVTWLPDGAQGEHLYVFVEVSGDVKEGQREVIRQASAEAIVAATGLSPDRVVIVARGSLPRTTSGKLRRREALRRYLGGELAPPDAVTPLHLARAVTRSWLAYGRRPGARHDDPGPSRD